VAYSKDIGNRKVGSEKVYGFLADFVTALVELSRTWLAELSRTSRSRD